MENPLLVFVSSIIGELFEERKAVEEAIEAIPLTRPWVFEHTPASADALDESYLSKVRECDIFVLLIAQNIFAPVRREYETALAYGKPRLVFLKDVERSAEAQAFVDQFDVKWAKISGTDELQQQVREAVIDELIKGYRRYRLKAAEVGRLEGLRWRAYLQAIIENKRFAQWGDERYIEEKTRPLPMRVAPYEFEARILEEQPKRDLIEAVEEIFTREDATKRRVLILGDPGAGKTTALERLMLLYTQRGQADDVALLPILVPLGSYAGQDSLISSLVASLNDVGRLKLTEKQVEVLLREGDCLVMLDGINELRRWREEGVRLIRSFMGIYPHHCYAITCRTQVYGNEFDDIEALEVQELEEEDIQRYLEVHLGEKKGRSLYRRLGKRLRGLARTPLMLRMIRDAGPSGELPRNKGELFRSFVHQMLWRERGKGARIPGEVKEGALAKLGYAMQEGRALRCSEREVRQAFTAYLRASEEEYGWRELLDEVVLNGLLKLAGWRDYTFMHQAMQEYFAAVALSTGETPEPDWQALAEDDWWAETIVLLSGIVEDASGLVSEVAKANALFACRCWFEGGEIKDETKIIVVDSLIEALMDSDWHVRWGVALTLGEIGDERAVGPLIEALMDSDWHVRWGAAWALGRIGDARALPELERVAREDRSKVARAARKAMRRIRQRIGNE